MARTVLSVKRLTERNQPHEAIASLTAALDATDGAEFSMRERDDKYLVLVQNASSSTAKSLTVKAGNGIEGVMDLTFSMAAGSWSFLSLDSARFKNMTGADKGKVVLTGPADIKVAVLCLP